MKYEELIQELFDKADKEYASFTKPLSNSDYEVIGIRIPDVKKIVKDHILDEELNVDDFVLGKYLEIDLIYFGLALSRIDKMEDKFKFLKKEIRKAKSWSITDTIPYYLRKCTYEEFWSFFLEAHKSKYTYERRMAYVLGLHFYKDERIIDVLSYINNDEEYMVMMSEAWLLATVAIKKPNEVYSFLKNTDDATLKRKTISKIVDSFRISEENKTKFKSLRK